MSGGKKRIKQKTYSAGDMKKLARRTADEATKRIILLTLVAARDECNLDADELVQLADRMQRYVRLEEEGLVDLKVASESLHKHTGIDLRVTRW